MLLSRRPIRREARSPVKFESWNQFWKLYFLYHKKQPSATDTNERPSYDVWKAILEEHGAPETYLGKDNVGKWNSYPYFKSRNMDTGGLSPANASSFLLSSRVAQGVTE